MESAPGTERGMDITTRMHPKESDKMGKMQSLLDNQVGEGVCVRGGG